MRLSELKTGEEGVIVKVYGHGGFRKRIVEMGFIKGTMVKSVLNAPLNDPVKYHLMDYEVSLRRAEAELVEVQEVCGAADSQSEIYAVPPIEEEISSAQRHRSEVLDLSHTINVAFVGNPNSGKTSLFNIAGHAHEHVGNYSGVTVDAKEGKVDFEGYHFNIIDLPGTYSLSAYTPEELYVRKHIIEKTPDVIINVVAASALERNLYLTTQLIDMDVPMVMALNMYDEFRELGDELDINQLSTLLGTPIIPTVGRTGEGVKELLHTVIEVYEGLQTKYRHIHINHGKEVESAIETLEVPIRKNPEPHHNYSGRFIAIKLLENDSQIESVVRRLDNADEIFSVREKCQRNISDEYADKTENVITDAKYGYIQGALKECLVKKRNRRAPSRLLTKHIDAVVTNKWAGYVIFLAALYLMFWCTFSIGQYPMDWIDAFVGWLSELTSTYLPDGPLKDLIVDGIIAGVGGVIVFLPNILILYAFISWMEDSGYMARTAFIMDRIMHRMGLHGKSFIPMIMGFGCGIPAIMATRTIEDRKSRLITMLIVPLMSCSARLPVYIIIIGAFFRQYQATMLFTLYVLGIVMSILMAHLFSKFVIKGESTPFVMELPPYRLPSAKSVFRHTWEKGKQYLKKMGTTILAASIIIWALTYFPRPDESANSQTDIEQSYIGRIGKILEPAIRPCGLSWKEGVSIVTGVGAKEIVASTMGVLYAQDAESSRVQPSTGSGTGVPEIQRSRDPEFQSSDGSEDAENARLSRIIANSGMTPLAAFAFLIFVLLYMPCIPACVTISKESGSLKWAVFTAVYTTALAWICATLVYQIGSMF